MPSFVNIHWIHWEIFSSNSSFDNQWIEENFSKIRTLSFIDSAIDLKLDNLSDNNRFDVNFELKRFGEKHKVQIAINSNEEKIFRLAATGTGNPYKLESYYGDIYFLANESLFQQQNITTFLRTDEYLSQLPIDSMLHCFVHHHYPVNTLFKEGLYLIKKGQVKCTMVRTRINRQVWEMPEERITKIVHPGEWLGKCFLEEFTDIQTYIVDSTSFLALSDVECYMIDIITLRKYFRGYITSSVASTCIESSPEMEEQSFEIIDPVLKFARRDDQDQGLKDLNLNFLKEKQKKSSQRKKYGNWNKRCSTIILASRTIPN